MVAVRHRRGKETLWVPFVKGGRGECVVASPGLQENCYWTKYLESFLCGSQMVLQEKKKKRVLFTLFQKYFKNLKVIPAL